VKKMRNAWALGAMAAVVLATAGGVWADPISFNLGGGGSVVFGGGNAPLVTTAGVVNNAVDLTTGTSVAITNGALNFTTGGQVLPPAVGTPFIDIFNAGGSLTITGSIAGGANAVLLQGTFLTPGTLLCCASSAAAFNDVISPSVMDPTLAADLGVVTNGGGSLAQTELVLNFTLSVPGEALPFSGIQAGGAVTVNNSSAVPEPTSLLLLGSGILGLGLWGYRKAGFE